jgi:hypothetical protein
MAGVRITHATARNARFTITESTAPYPVPYTCTPPEFGGCGSTHLFKTHHLNVDELGAAIVNDVLYEKIRGLLVLNGFTESNVVARPPTQGLGMAAMVEGRGSWGNVPIIHGTGG